MNKAIINKPIEGYFPATDYHAYNVQIWTSINGKYVYCGNGELCKTREQIEEVCMKYNVPKERREWSIEVEDANGDVWKILCPDELAQEVMRNTVNWFNFRNNDFYWSDNGSSFGVDITGNIVILYEM